MTKQEFLAMSLPYGLNLMQSRTHWFNPEQDGKVLLVGMSEWDLLMPEQYKNIPTNITVFYRVNENSTGSASIEYFKPILHPLSDLTKEIEHKGEDIYPIGAICQKYRRIYPLQLIAAIQSGSVDLNIAIDLIKWHFDIADLISKGEAIDVNTLEENPYK